MTMLDISTEIETIRNGVYGSEIKQAIVDALAKIMEYVNEEPEEGEDNGS